MKKSLLIALSVFLAFIANVYSQDTLVYIPVNNTDSLKDVSSKNNQTRFYTNTYTGFLFENGKDGMDSSSVYFGVRQYVKINNTNLPLNTHEKDILFSISVRFEDEDGYFPSTEEARLFSQHLEFSQIPSHEFEMYFNYEDSTISTNMNQSRVKLKNIDQWNTVEVLVRNSNLTSTVLINGEAVNYFHNDTIVSFNNEYRTMVGIYPRYIFGWVDNIKIISFDNYSLPITNAEAPKGWIDGSGGTIMNLSELRWLSETIEAWDEEWELGTDINAYETRFWNITGTDTLGFSPIGRDGYDTNLGTQLDFMGSFNGNGHIISNLYINRPQEDYVGLFGSATWSDIYKVALVDCNITGKDHCGSIAGFYNGFNLYECYSTGSVTGNSKVGGMFGTLYKSEIRDCFTSVDVSGDSKVGGFAGTNNFSIDTKNSYSLGKVTGNSDVHSFQGYSDGGTFTNSYTCTNKSGASINSSSLVIDYSDKDFESKSNFLNWNFNTIWTITTIPEFDSLPRPYFQWMSDTKIKTTSFELKEGWNIISMNVNPSNNNLTELFPNATTIKNLDNTLNPLYSTHLNKLNSVQYGDVFLVNNSMQETINISGESYTDTIQLELNKGWNLLSYLGDEEISIDSALYQINTTVETVKDIQSFYYAGDLTNSNLLTFKPGKGYYLKLKESVTYFWPYLINESDPETGTVTDIDGNVYPWKQFGKQYWMTVNLRTTRYADGTEIPYLPQASSWETLGVNDKAYCFVDTTGKNYPNYKKELFGMLYTWAAAVNGNIDTVGVQGACPNGWHIPSEDEWRELEKHLGMIEDTIIKFGYRGGTEGSKIAGGKEFWGVDNALTDSQDFGETDFYAVPSGLRFVNGDYWSLGSGAYWWGATQESEKHVWTRSIARRESNIGRYYDTKQFGFAVRCVRD